jgi:hypothetical protein
MLAEFGPCPETGVAHDMNATSAFGRVEQMAKGTVGP